MKHNNAIVGAADRGTGVPPVGPAGILPADYDIRKTLGSAFDGRDARRPHGQDARATRPAPRLLVSLAALCFLAAHAFAANTTDSQPRSAEDELKAFQAADGLQVELVAAEPLVQSPCAMAFDERGRLFVAENRGYPIGPAEGQPPVGTIAMLEDTHGDGRFDKRTTFADGLTFPNGVMPWQGGLIVTCAPDVLFLQDRNGDGKADVRRVLLTGFETTKSTQLRVNKPTLGPDGWIYFAAGLAGGTITSPEHPDMAPLKMTGDLRWNPRTGEYRNVDGKSQYGMSFDDFGRRFICMNRIQVQHVVLSSFDLQRNPNLAFSDTVQNCPELIPNLLMHSTGGAARIYPISSNITTADSHVGTFSAACAITIWRGGALPEQYRGCAISCEPTGNLVHVDKLEPKGATFAAVPLLDKTELLASRDDWTRPVFLESGPDGALYVCDMYRRVIEHPDYLPAEIRKHTNFEGGKELGRIWRITKKGTVYKTSPALEGTAGKLIAAVAKGDGWTSATAFRLLNEDQGIPLNVVARSTDAREQWAKASPAGRAALLHLLFPPDAASTNYGFPFQDLERALRDEDPGVQAVAYRVAAGNQANRWAALEFRLPATAAPSVAFQRTLLAGRFEAQGDFNRCAEILVQGEGDRWQEAAILSACPGKALELVQAIRRRPGPRPSLDFYSQAGRLIAVERKELTPADLITEITPGAPEAFAVTAGFCGARKTGAAPLLTMEDATTAALLKRAVKALGTAGAKPDPGAVALLSYAPWEVARAPLFGAAFNRDEPKVAEVALRALASEDAPEVTATLLTRERWDAATPAEREAVIGALIGRPQHLAGILDAIERKDIPASAIASVRRAAFAKSKEAAIRDRAAKLFTAATGDRQKVFDEAKACLTLTPAPEHGHQLFTQICATCHRLNQEGSAVGPDLFDMRNQPKESILFHIIIPDAEIAPVFTAYLAETKDGRTLAGLLASETTTSITLRMPLAQEETILRSNLAKLTALPNSLMPTGLDAALSKQDLADLLAFLKGEK
ncbi:MAG TPA: PVC-type heme-binding CxxCH protein [Chthoniobacteraceae bacterium]|jgi:putative membrane-bound dehydrogenase-like protein|nr:PVC-type heme-binding CxxCH protein [Chthoniobacteraceae bacterium]